LYLHAEERQRRRFSEVIAQGVADPRLYMLMSMRTDFLAELQKDEPLYKVRRQIDVPPLREPELRAVVSRPAELPQDAEAIFGIVIGHALNEARQNFRLGGFGLQLRHRLWCCARHSHGMATASAAT